MGCGSLAALTLSEAELSRPKALLDDLRLITRRPVDGAQEEQEAATEPQADSEGAKEGGGLQQAEEEPAVLAEDAPAGVLGGGVVKAAFLTPAVAEEEARRASSSESKHLVETAWLRQRFPKATLGDLLVNQLEISLWASYWDRRRPQASAG